MNYFYISFRWSSSTSRSGFVRAASQRNQPALCSDDDFETLILIGHKLLLHSAMVYQMLPQNKDAAPGEIGQSLIQKQFFQMLPTDFTKQDAVKMAQVLGVSVNSLDR